MDDAVGQSIRPHSADDRLTLATPTHLDAKDPVEQPDTQGRTTHHADTQSYAAQANSPKQPQQIGASRLRSHRLSLLVMHGSDGCGEQGRVISDSIGCGTLIQERPMATLMIRDLDEDTKARLRVQAAEHGRSMEAEARQILRAALSGRRPPRGLGSYINEQFAEVGGFDLEIVRSSEAARTADFSA